MYTFWVQVNVFYSLLLVFCPFQYKEFNWGFLSYHKILGLEEALRWLLYELALSARLSIALHLRPVIQHWVSPVGPRPGLQHQHLLPALLKDFKLVSYLVSDNLLTLFSQKDQVSLIKIIYLFHFKTRKFGRFDKIHIVLS